tara:strand:+ start:1046 stop:2050 length:1005 start_codon:yes stop_codon:yes gene_type:complete
VNGWLERIFIVVVFASLTATQPFAQPHVESISVSAPVRYDHRLETDSGDAIRSRIQYQLAIRYDVGLFEFGGRRALNLKGLLGTGEKYTSQWNRFYDRLDDAPLQQPLNMRQVFLQWSDDFFWLQAGVIPPVKGTVSATSLDRDGWIRGARIVLKTWADGRVEFVGGALDHLEDPNGFQWWDDANYAEFEWTQPYGAVFRSEFGLVRLSEQLHIRGEARALTRALASMPMEFAAEYLYNFKRNTPAYDLNGQMTWAGMTLFFEYSHVDENFGLLGALSNDFFTFGHLYHMTVRYRPERFMGFGLFLKAYRGEETSEFKTGLSYSYRYQGQSDRE